MRKIASRRVFQVSFIVIFAISLVVFLARGECACRKLAGLTWCEWDGWG